MCLIAVANQFHPDYPILMVGNRDEFLSRDTLRASWWPEHPNVFAGKDLKAGGTWTGINAEGKFAALTNWRIGRDKLFDAPSRGDLVLNYLTEDKGPKEYLYQVRK